MDLNALKNYTMINGVIFIVGFNLFAVVVGGIY